MERKGPIECYECGAEICPDDDYMIWDGHAHCMDCGQAAVMGYLGDETAFREHVHDLAEVLGFAVERGASAW